MLLENKLRKLRTNTVFKNGVLFTMFSFLNSGINFLLLIILANFISPLEYGELNLFNTFVTLLSMLISLNTTGIISVEFFKTSRTQFRKILNGVLLLSTGTLCFFYFLIAGFFSYPKAGGRPFNRISMVGIIDLLFTGVFFYKSGYMEIGGETGILRLV